MRFAWGAIVVAVVGIGLWIARPYLDGTPGVPAPDQAEAPAAVEDAPPDGDASDVAAVEAPDTAEPAEEAVPSETSLAAPSDRAEDADEGATMAAEPDVQAIEAPDTTAETAAASETEPSGEGVGLAAAESGAGETSAPEAPQAASDEGSSSEEIEQEEIATAPDDAQEGAPADASAMSEAAAAPEDTSAPALATPEFDVVRVAPGGSALIAGTAEPGSTVQVLVNGTPESEARADASGEFVAMFSIEPSENAQVISLETEMDGSTSRSDEEIIVAPMSVASEAEDATPEEAEAADMPLADADTGTADEAPGDTGSGAEQELASAAQTDAPDPDPTLRDTGPAAPTLLLSGNDGVRVIQSEAPVVMDRVAIDAITYDVEGEVLLTGRAGIDGFVRIYLNNRAILTTEIAEDGNWQTPLPEVDTGVYTLRVDAIDSSGTVTARAETPFLREDVESVRGIADDLEAARVEDIVTVQPGDHLWGISLRRYGRGMQYVQVYNANRDQIRDPDLIYPGQIFELPR